MRINEQRYVPSSFVFTDAHKMICPRLYMGVELEVDSREEDRAACVDRLFENDNINQFWYPKLDKGLEEFGVELVSHPRTLFSWMKKGPLDLEAIREHFKAPSQGYGLHVHVNKVINEFGKTDKPISNLNLDGKLIRTITQALDTYYIRQTNRRYQNTVGGPCAMHNNDNDPYYINDPYYHRRHYFINTNPSSTVEFRGGKATTYWDRFLTTLEFVDSVARFSLICAYGKHSYSYKNDYYNYVSYNKAVYRNIYGHVKTVSPNVKEFTGHGSLNVPQVVEDMFESDHNKKDALIKRILKPFAA
jgi:hypothetical protein